LGCVLLLFGVDCFGMTRGDFNLVIKFGRWSWFLWSLSLSLFPFWLEVSTKSCVSSSVAIVSSWTRRDSYNRVNNSEREYSRRVCHTTYSIHGKTVIRRKLIKFGLWDCFLWCTLSFQWWLQYIIIIHLKRQNSDHVTEEQRTKNK
jgi:hypothetical protein